MDDLGNLTLSTAPNHVFVRYINDAGQTFNFEATNGGFARDSHYRKEMPITDAAIANGVYMKSLSRRESLAVMGNLIVEHLMATRRHREAIATADVILATYPAEVSTILTKANGYLHLLEETMVLRDDGFGEVPAALIPYAEELDRTNLALVARAEALGWRPWDYRPPEADAVASDLIGGRMP